MARAFAEISFTPSVLALQQQFGSADGYAGFLEPDADRGDRIGAEEAQFIRQRDGFYLATVSADGWPYVQFRGGPAGFLKVLDAQTLAYADFRGNRQYLSAGNLTDNDRVALILMDYPNRRRLKIWGKARWVDAKSDPSLLATVRDETYRGLVERTVVISVEAVDWNCPQHIPRRMTLEEFEPHLEEIRSEMAGLKRENESLRKALGERPQLSAAEEA